MVEYPFAKKLPNQVSSLLKKNGNFGNQIHNTNTDIKTETKTNFNIEIIQQGHESKSEKFQSIFDVNKFEIIAVNTPKLPIDYNLDSILNKTFNILIDEIEDDGFRRDPKNVGYVCMHVCMYICIYVYM